MAETTPIKRGQSWKRNKGPGSDVKIMTMVDGYVMYRSPGCFPLVDWYVDFLRHFTNISSSQQATPK